MALHRQIDLLERQERVEKKDHLALCGEVRGIINLESQLDDNLLITHESMSDISGFMVKMRAERLRLEQRIRRAEMTELKAFIQKYGSESKRLIKKAKETGVMTQTVINYQLPVVKTEPDQDMAPY